MNSILTVIINTIKSKLQIFISRIKMWMSPTYIKTRFIATIQKFANSITAIKPKNQRDYYTIGAWQVAKRLAYFIVVLIGIVCMIYVINLARIYSSSSRTDSIKTYPYNSLLLRFVNEECRITAKSKYVAFQGEVSKGACNGKGTLYRKDGTTVYIGDFASSKFNGQGTSYYPNQNMEYTGDFVDNLFSGQGTLYRTNASTEYIGQFFKGMKDGHGILYNAGSNAIYEGTFSCNNIVYSEMVGKNNSDIANMYTGTKTVYELDQENKFVVTLDEIGALYAGKFADEALNDEVTAGVVYVLDDTFNLGNKSYTSISEIQKDFGTPTYEGNAYLNMAEAVSINKLLETKSDVLNGAVTMETEKTYSDYTVVDSFDDTYLIYIYGFEKDGMIYTFVADSKTDKFAFYYIQLSDDSGVSTDSTVSSDE